MLCDHLPNEPSCLWCDRPQAREHAALMNDQNWADKATQFILNLPTGTRFTFDQVTSGVGLLPESSGVSGAVARKLSAQKLIVVSGIATATRKTSHGRLLREWMRTDREAA